MNTKTCPQCGAAYDPHENKCPYCGVSYFDMSCLDITKREPFYLKMKIPYGDCDAYITQLVVPVLSNIEVSNDTREIMSSDGRFICSFAVNRNVITNLSFQSIEQKNGVLYEIKKV